MSIEGVITSLTRRRVPRCSTDTGWSDHERVSLGPSACQDACRLPQLQVSNDSSSNSSSGRHGTFHCIYAPVYLPFAMHACI